MERKSKHVTFAHPKTQVSKEKTDKPVSTERKRVPQKQSTVQQKKSRQLDDTIRCQQSFEKVTEAAFNVKALQRKVFTRESVSEEENHVELEHAKQVDKRLYDVEHRLLRIKAETSYLSVADETILEPLHKIKTAGTTMVSAVENLTEIINSSMKRVSDSSQNIESGTEDLHSAMAVLERALNELRCLSITN